MKKKVYNSYSKFSKIIGLRFSQSSRFWKFADAHTKDSLISAPSKPTAHGDTDRDALTKRVCDYPLAGPLGSQDPNLPVCEKDILAKLNDPTNTLSESWEKRNIFSWSETLDKSCPMYKPSRRAVATSRLLMRLQGDACMKHSRKRIASLSELRPLRDLPKSSFGDFRGVDLGMTVGIFARGSQPFWRDIALVDICRVARR